MGMVAGLIYLVTMFVFIPFPFMKWFTASRDGHPQELTLLTFPNLKVMVIYTRTYCLGLVLQTMGQDKLLY